MTRRTLAAALAASSLLPACGVRGLDFKQDHRVSITTPADRAEVTVPLTVRWRVRGFTITGRDGGRRADAGYFGVYVDRAPQPPQKTQESLARDLPQCAGVPDCPDEYVLAQLNVHSTTETSFTILRLPAPPSEGVRRREFHEVTIVFLNGRGERIGESAFTRQFEVDREA